MPRAPRIPAQAAVRLLMRLAMLLRPSGPCRQGDRRGNVGQQCLRRADIGRGLVSANVLLTGLEGEPICGKTLAVDADADQAPGERSSMLFGCCHETCVRSAEPHWHTKALGTAHHDVGADFARWRGECAIEKVGGDCGGGIGFVKVVDDRFQVTHYPG